MPLRKAKCANCQTLFDVPDAGGAVSCPACKAVFDLPPVQAAPAAPAEEAVDPAAAAAALAAELKGAAPAAPVPPPAPAAPAAEIVDPAAAAAALAAELRAAPLEVPPDLALAPASGVAQEDDLVLQPVDESLKLVPSEIPGLAPPGPVAVSPAHVAPAAAGPRQPPSTVRVRARRNIGAPAGEGLEEGGEVAEVGSAHSVAGLAMTALGVLLLLIGVLFFIKGAEPPPGPSMLELKKTRDDLAVEVKDLTAKADDLKTRVAKLDTDRAAQIRRMDLQKARQADLDRRFAEVGTGMASEFKKLAEAKDRAEAERAKIGETLAQGAKPASEDFAALVARCEKKAVVVVTDVGSGSGFLISADGLVATNYHVVRGLRTLEVRIQKRDSREQLALKDARVVAAWPANDLALIQMPPVDQAVAENGGYPFVEIRNETARTGESVFAIGSPGLGDLILDYTVTKGIVSNASRTLESTEMLQTSAPVNPGNSGGPLFDEKGRVLGVVSAKGVTVEATTFAILPRYLQALVRDRSKAPYLVAGALDAWEATNNPEVMLERKAQEWEEKNCIDLDGKATSLILSKDGGTLYLLMGDSGTIQAFDLVNRKAVRSLDLNCTIVDWTQSGFSSDFALLISHERREMIRVWLPTLEERGRTSLPEAPQAIRTVGARNDWPVLFCGREDMNQCRLINPADLEARRQSLGDLMFTNPRTCSVDVNRYWLCMARFGGMAYSLTFYPSEELLRIQMQLSQLEQQIRQAAARRLNTAPLLQQKQDLEKKRSELGKGITVRWTYETSMDTPNPKPIVYGQDRVVFGLHVIRLGKDLNVLGQIPPSPLLRNVASEAGELWRLLLNLESVRSVSPDGIWGASATQIVNLSTMQPMRLMPIMARVSTFSRDGKSLYVLSAKGTRLGIIQDWEKNLPQIPKEEKKGK